MAKTKQESFTKADLIDGLRTTWHAIAVDYVALGKSKWVKRKDVQDAAADYMSQHSSQKFERATALSRAFHGLTDEQQQELLDEAFPDKRYGC